MAESILFTRVDKILGKVASLALEQFWLARDLNSDLHKLETTLSGIKAVVLDAEDQPSSNHRIAFWLKQLKDALYDAEDVLDDFAYETLRRQVLDATSSAVINQRKVRRFFSTSNPVAFRLRMGRKIKEIRLRLDEIASLKAQLNLTERLDNNSVLLREREMTHSFVNSSDIVGREGDRDVIVEFLMDFGHEHGASVIPIVGIGGLGKTAVAKMVFNDHRIDDHFNPKLWVCLGDMKEFTVNQVMAKIVKDHSSDPQQLQIAIRNVLGNKKFLLILDDMWKVNRDKWLELKSLLACGAKGSKIVVTTRLSSVASCVGTTQTHYLEGLPHEECVSLFKKLAFDGEDKVDQDLMKIGDEIVRKCKGVPLAVRSLGSMLFSNSDQSEWLFVRDSDIWQIEENQDGILPILKFSYDHLPSHLKQCFVYCSVFPEDYYFRDIFLISFWMAHGLLQSPKRNQEPELVGMQYIKELSSRGFFQDFLVDNDVAQGGETWRFKMHDLIRELACSLGQEEFAMISNGKSVPKNVRHVCFGKEEDFLTNSSNAIRTVVLIPQNNEFVEECISKFEQLRVLWVPHSELKELPSFIHLRSLDLSNCRRLKRLPDSICKMHNLECLWLLGCSELEEVPENMGDLVSLRRLGITTKLDHFPKNGIGRLASLQFLLLENCVNLECIFEGRQLHLTSLQTLAARGCNRLRSIFRSSNIRYYMPSLEVLHMSECENLNLNMAGSGKGNASQCLHLPRLGSLYISKVSRLETLPDWIEGSARALQLLRIDACHNLRVLPNWLSKFTSLHTLEIYSCNKLSALPQGRPRLTALQKLSIISCNVELCARYFGSSATDGHEVAHIPHFVIR